VSAVSGNRITDIVKRRFVRPPARTDRSRARARETSHGSSGAKGEGLLISDIRHDPPGSGLVKCRMTSPAYGPAASDDAMDKVFDHTGPTACGQIS